MIEVAVDTKTKILDAAEKLFGSKGFDATSLRDITAEAEVNLAAVNYHFQTKESLIDAVIARRLEPVNRRRLEMLAAAGPNATVEQLVEAFVLPVIQQDVSSILPMMGRAFAGPDQFLVRIFKRIWFPSRTGFAMHSWSRCRGCRPKNAAGDCCFRLDRWRRRYRGHRS